MKTPLYLLEDLSFGGGHENQVIKFGEIMAERLGVENVNVNYNKMSLSFSYKNIFINFSNFSPLEIKTKMEENGIQPDLINTQIYNRDFTINMFAYDFLNNKYLDVSRSAQKDSNNRILRTFFDANDICQQNPMIILRALKLKIRHDLSLDPLLEKAMKDYANLIFDGRYSDLELIIARENIRKEGKNKADELFSEFGIENINSVQ